MRPLWFAVLLLACVEYPSPAIGQTPRFVVMDDYVRERLATDWDAHLHDAPIHERGYCVRWQRDFWAGESAFRITQVWPADSVSATPQSVSFVCPREANVATLHVHPPQSCDGAGCYPGGVYAWQCLLSDRDRAYLAWRGDAFLSVQCSREAVVSEVNTGLVRRTP